MHKMQGAVCGEESNPIQKKTQQPQTRDKKTDWRTGPPLWGTGCGYQHFSVQLIDQVEKGDKVALAEKEVYWQNQLRCYVQNGGHAHCYRKEK